MEQVEQDQSEPNSNSEEPWSVLCFCTFSLLLLGTTILNFIAYFASYSWLEVPDSNGDIQSYSLSFLPGQAAEDINRLLTGIFALDIAALLFALVFGMASPYFVLLGALAKFISIALVIAIVIVWWVNYPIQEQWGRGYQIIFASFICGNVACVIFAILLIAANFFPSDDKANNSAAETLDQNTADKKNEHHENETVAYQGERDEAKDLELAVQMAERRTQQIELELERAKRKELEQKLRLKEIKMKEEMQRLTTELNKQKEVQEAIPLATEVVEATEVRTENKDDIYKVVDDQV